MLFARLKFLENFPLPSSFFEDNYFRAKINLPCDQRKKENSLEKGSACSRPISSLTLCSNHFSRICAQWTPAASTGPLSSQSRGIVRAILDPAVLMEHRWPGGKHGRVTAHRPPKFRRIFRGHLRPLYAGARFKITPPFFICLFHRFGRLDARCEARVPRWTPISSGG